MLRKVSLIIVLSVCSCLLLTGSLASIENPAKSVDYFNVNVDHLNLRDSPNGKEISILLKGTQVKEIGKEGNWVNVELAGWAWSPYLTFDKTVTIAEPKPEIIKTIPSPKETVYVVKEVIKTPSTIEHEKEMKHMEKEKRVVREEPEKEGVRIRKKIIREPSPVCCEKEMKGMGKCMMHEQCPMMKKMEGMMMKMPGMSQEMKKEVVWPPEDILRDIGHSRGFREGWKEGKGEGYLMGKSDGHRKGYNKGKRIGKFLGFLHGSSCTLILGGVAAAIYYYYEKLED